MQNSPPLLKTEEELRECSKRMQDLVVGVNASINKCTYIKFRKLSYPHRYFQF